MRMVSIYISGIIDFERSFYGDPYAEFIAFMMICDNVEEEKEFLAGYSEVKGTELIFTEADRIRMMLYRIYMFVHLGVETYRYEESYAEPTLAYIRSQLELVLGKLEQEKFSI